MDYKPGSFYDIKWNDKEFKHCELLEIIPGTNLAAVRTPNYEYFEIHTDFLTPEIKETEQKTAENSKTIDKDSACLKTEVKTNIDIEEIEKLVDLASKSVAAEFKNCFNSGSDPLMKIKATKYDKACEIIKIKLQECDKVINDEFALKKNILKANTIKDVLLEVQSFMED